MNEPGPSSEIVRSSQAWLSLSSGASAQWPPEPRVAGQLTLTSDTLEFTPTEEAARARRWDDLAKLRWIRAKRAGLRIWTPIRLGDPNIFEGFDLEFPGVWLLLFPFVVLPKLVVFVVEALIAVLLYVVQMPFLLLIHRNAQREILVIERNVIFVQSASEWASTIRDARSLLPQPVVRAEIPEFPAQADLPAVTASATVAIEGAKQKLERAAERIGLSVYRNPRTTRIQITDQVRIIVKVRIISLECISFDESQRPWQRLQALDVRTIHALPEETLVGWLQEIVELNQSELGPSHSI